MPISLEDLTTDQLLAHARQLQTSHDTMAAIAADPALRGDLQALLKKKNPALVIPELDAKHAVAEELKQRDERMSKIELDILQERTKRRLEEERATVKAKYHLSDTDIVEVEKLMTDEDPNKRIPTYESAARVYKAERTQTRPTPSSLTPNTFEMPEKDVWSAGIGSKAALDKIALSEAYKAWNEITAPG
jgi:ABC-type Fe3+/spermidine/putrescine transport system ATPase subunit